MESNFEVFTQELTGGLSDVLPFASTDPDDLANNVVRLESDGTSIFTSAAERFSCVRYTWDPHSTEILGGSSDFSVRITVADVKRIVSAFKLPAKLGYTPLQVRVSLGSVADSTYLIEIFRDGSDNVSALRMYVVGRGAPVEGDGRPTEPKIFGLIGSIARHLGSGSSMAFPPERLAAFGKVRAHGPVEFSYTTGADNSASRAIFVTVGHRFNGVIFPVRPTKPGQVLRDGEYLEMPERQTVPVPAEYLDSAMNDVAV